MGSSSVSPNLKEVVEMLMKKDGEETKTVPSRNNPSTRRDVTFLIYKCPRDRLCTTKGVFKFEKGARYSNPFHHLHRCLAGGSKDDLLRMYYAAKDERQRNSAFPTQHISAANLREKSMYAYLRFIVLHSLPLSFVEEKDVWECSSCHYTVQGRR